MRGTCKAAPNTHCVEIAKRREAIHPALCQVPCDSPPSVPTTRRGDQVRLSCQVWQGHRQQGYRATRAGLCGNVTGRDPPRLSKQYQAAKVSAPRAMLRRQAVHKIAPTLRNEVSTPSTPIQIPCTVGDLRPRQPSTFLLGQAKSFSFAYAIPVSMSARSKPGQRETCPSPKRPQCQDAEVHQNISPTNTR